MNLPHHRHLSASVLTDKQWEVIKWTGNMCLLLGTIAMISPTVAATAVTPWVLYLIGNLAWLLDSIHVRSTPWIYIASFLAFWDVILIISRITGFYVFQVFDPIIHILNNLP